MARSKDDGDCRIWTGSKNVAGYGKIGLGDEVVGYTHRLAYILEHGAIPDGLEIDHLCRRRDCIKGSHLEAVTHAENRRRAALLSDACVAGHLWTDESTYWNGSSRYCRICHATSERDRRARMNKEE